MLLAERYRTIEILGHGGMGEVYRGCDERLGRPVAVKLLRPDLRDPLTAARFQHEARAAAVVRHPHVIAVYDFGHSNGEYYLVMELVEGHSVGRELTLHGPFDPEAALDIVRQVAAGLTAAHRHGVVHRDIKPDNLLIDADGSVKIADFGIARAPADPAITSSGLIPGTSLYLAPERALGHPATAASDVYALGCVLYQLLTGRPPFEAADPTEIMCQHVRAEPALPDDLPAPLVHLLRLMLSKDPADRPSPAEVATWTYDVPADAPTTELAALRPARHWRRAVAVLAAVIVAGTAVTAGVLTDQESNTPLAPANVSPTQPPRQAMPAPRPTTAPTVTVTTVVTSRRPRASSSSTSHPAGKPVTKAPEHPRKAKPKKPGKH
ncbi:serine/threonine-protein kinase [Kribbella karoonensis]|uniref:Protein kinase domain-containing protein n=1 Tax=Kribbella karoonensis TaxID=324851 RepID=A0ABN2ELB3_9ACTN